jgi:hypothetical protein
MGAGLDALPRAAASLRSDVVGGCIETSIAETEWGVGDPEFT